MFQISEDRCLSHCPSPNTLSLRFSPYLWYTSVLSWGTLFLDAPLYTVARVTGDTNLIPGPGRSPGGGYGNPLQCSCLENPMDLAGYSPWGRKESDTTEATKHSIPYIMCFQPKNLWPSSGLNNSQPWLLQVLLLLQSLFFFHWKDQTHDAIFLNYLPCLLQLSLFISEPILSEFQRTVFQFTDYVFNYRQCHSYLLFLSSWTPHSCVKLGWFLHPSESQLLLNGIVIPHF